MRVGVGARVYYRGDDGGKPAQPLAAGTDRGAAGAKLGAEGSVLVGVLVAARRARALAVLAPVRISLEASVACTAFGKIIVPCARQPPPPSRCICPAAATQFRLRQNAGRGSGRKSKRLHGAHSNPARRVPDKPGEGEGSA